MFIIIASHFQEVLYYYCYCVVRDDSKIQIQQSCLVLFKDFLLYIYECFACICVHPGCAWYPHRPDESTGCPGSRVMDGYELPGRHWALNLDPQARTENAHNHRACMNHSMLVFFPQYCKFNRRPGWTYSVVHACYISIVPPSSILTADCKCLLSTSFCQLRIWEWFSWECWLRVCYMAALEIEPTLWSSQAWMAMGDLFPKGLLSILLTEDSCPHHITLDSGWCPMLW